MTTPTEIAKTIVGREGGYVNDPDDPGGATKYGVTIRTMRGLGMDLDGDGRVTAADVKLLTRAQAEDIFLRHYFYGPRIHELPEEIQSTVFDMQVNAGGNAIKILQRLLSRMGFPCSVDGALGPQTIGAAREAHRKAGRALYNSYGAARRSYYMDLARRRPSSRKYAQRRNGGKGGWITRAEEFIDPEYHWTDAQFQQEVAKWH